MKNRGLIIFTIILLSITIFLLVMFLVTYLSGGVNFRSGIINFINLMREINVGRRLNESIMYISVKYFA